MVVSWLVVVLVLAAAGAGIAVLPDSWSDNRRAVATILLVVVGALAVVGLAAFHVLEEKARRRVTIFVGIVFLLVAVGALAIARGLPLGLEYDWRWAFGAVAAVAIVIAAVSLAYGRLPEKIQGGARSWRGIGAVLLVAVSTVFLVVAVLVSDIPSWLRWSLAIGGLALIVAAHRLRQVAWPDVAALGLVALGAVAAFGEYTERDTKEPPPTITFTIDDPVKALGTVEEGDAVLLVVEAAEVTEDDTPISYESARHEVTVDRTLPDGDLDQPVRVTIERGAKDANALALSADLEGAVAVYLLPGSQ